jgi:hypothetical protein|tara:strand:+ start:51 stop:266 length:216 start_codon:yes stop_codon:yes gene_type:complete
VHQVFRFPALIIRDIVIIYDISRTPFRKLLVAVKRILPLKYLSHGWSPVSAGMMGDVMALWLGVSGVFKLL